MGSNPTLSALKAQSVTGFFIVFNRLTNPINQPSIPGTIARTSWAFLLDTDIVAVRCYDQAVAPRPPMSEEQTKKQEIKEESAEEELLKNELTEDELKDVSGGTGMTEQSVNNWIDERIHFLDPSA
ncbi:hypothetical protein [Synechococcus sp. A18-25c]|uniref:hypothetical protein n=1 Tax=Synechococcus sp. A18-25c TaxID=1866938 RepID=UPI001647319B|nr:hypothetical protein [Synechococcus sp. A18-25c]